VRPERWREVRHDPRLAGVRHGFALSEACAPAQLARPSQVHGAAVVEGDACRQAQPAPQADAVVCARRGLPVGVVTADCVPLLLATREGAAVAAVHAGWRGLARGVVEAGVEALVRLSGEPRETLRAAIGPHVGPCCYEVDAPVLEALGRFDLSHALRPSRPGHALLDLGAVALAALAACGVPAGAVGRATAVCTCCDPRRLASYRRDGSRAGRLVHFIEASAPEG
jgi:YfiH family protein